MNNELRALLELCLRNLNGGGDSLTGTEHARAYKELRSLLAAPAEVNGEDVLRWMDEHAAAQPVPPAGGELPERKSAIEVFSQYGLGACSGWNAACDAWGPHVTRLQVELETAHRELRIARSDIKVEQNVSNNLRQHKNDYMEAAEETRRALQSELDALKAQPQGEPVAIVRNEGFGKNWVDVIRPAIEQCKPGDKLYPAEQPAPVAVVLPARKTAEEYYMRLGNCNSARLAADEFNSALDEVARLNSL
ncbi:hypothetical protein [Pseudomonas chlororaphis]|uniref:hypothetical protein n=1 Tax=Pseudomonas chlororaphis TaxID=587753 RepID=UPI0039E165C5